MERGRPHPPLRLVGFLLGPSLGEEPCGDLDAGGGSPVGPVHRRIVHPIAAAG